MMSTATTSGDVTRATGAPSHGNDRAARILGRDVRDIHGILDDRAARLVALSSFLESTLGKRNWFWDIEEWLTYDDDGKAHVRWTFYLFIAVLILGGIVVWFIT
jgi:hypothetical protein